MVIECHAVHDVSLKVSVTSAEPEQAKMLGAGVSPQSRSKIKKSKKVCSLALFVGFINEIEAKERKHAGGERRDWGPV